MKKLPICLLTLLLIFSGGIYALADEEPVAQAPVVSPIRVDSGIAPAEESGTLSGDMARVTQAVKTTLGVDDSFTDFYGNQSESGQGVIWYLNWNNSEESISVEADNDGMIFSYSRYSYFDRYDPYISGYAPIFPKSQRAQAQAVAEEFMRRVLGANEAFLIQADDNTPLVPRVQYDFYFSGNIALGGVPSPLYTSVTVDAARMRVSYFWRQNLANEYVGDIPSPNPKISAGQAVRTLAPLQKFTLAYYLTDSGQNEARLQYRPVSDQTYYVDAQTGAVIDVNKLYEEAQKSVIDRGLSKGGEGMAYDTASAAPEAAAVQLSGVEQVGIDKLEGLLTREELDAKLRAISELGLDDGYILSSINYRQDYQYKSNGDRVALGGYNAFLNYYREAKPLELGLSEQAYQKLKGEGIGLYIHKYAQMNAATGEFVSISTSRPYVEEALITEKERDFRDEAAAFLEKYFGDYYAQSAPDENYLLNIRSNAYYHYARQVNGYSFVNNIMDVSVNPYTGVIESFYMNWDEDVSFAPTTGIISEAKAKSVFLDTLECRLLYRGLPQAVDPAQSAVQPLRDYYGGLVYRMALVYAYEAAASGEVYAIDALSGETIGYGKYERSQLAYDDIEGSAAKSQIEELARYRIGFEGGKFKPAAKLTELDMLIFLLSADGYTYVTGELAQESINSIYSMAYLRGIIARGSQQPQRQISRGEYLKVIIAMSGYGKTAMLPGIYACNFADEADIPAELYGYVAIAQGLGLVEGGKTLEFKAAEVINRAEAAVIFYNFMAREY